MSWLAALALLFGIRDIDGVDRRPMNPARGHVQALFFVAADCPVSNYYAQEIRRVCEAYAPRGLACALVYVDPRMTDADARRHSEEYGHGAYPKIVDRRHELVAATGAAITPQVAVVTQGGTVAYTGRIDNYYAALGKPRRVITEHDLRDALDAVFSGRKPLHPASKAVGCYIPELSAFQ